MKKIFAMFMILACGVIMLPASADAQTYTTRRVYRNGRLQTVRVYRTSGVNRTTQYNGRYRRGMITTQERRRLARERMRYTRLRNRTTRDGYITPKEAHKLNRRANKYRRHTRRARNN